MFNEMLIKAINLVFDKFDGISDKSDKPMAAHSLRVMARMIGYPIDFVIVATLHDVVEDTDVTLLDLQNMGFSDTVVEAVDAITRREGLGWKESYEKYLVRVKANIIARAVKVFADLPDNTSEERHIALPPEESKRLMKKYTFAKEFLKYEDDRHAHLFRSGTSK